MRDNISPSVWSFAETPRASMCGAHVHWINLRLNIDDRIDGELLYAQTKPSYSVFCWQLVKPRSARWTVKLDFCGNEVSERYGSRWPNTRGAFSIFTFLKRKFRMKEFGSALVTYFSYGINLSYCAVGQRTPFIYKALFGLNGIFVILLCVE